MQKEQMQQHRDCSTLGNYNPRTGQGRVLAILKMKPDISQKELLFLLDTTKQALASLLVKLEKNGYIKRERCEDDKRELNITLTDKGKSVANNIEQDSVNDRFDIVDCLNKDELELFGKLLDKILDAYMERYKESEHYQEKKKMFDDFIHNDNFDFENMLDAESMPNLGHMLTYMHRIYEINHKHREHNENLMNDYHAYHKRDKHHDCKNDINKSIDNMEE